MRFVAMACVAGLCWLVTSPPTRISRVQTPGERATPRRGVHGGSLVEAPVPRAILCATSLVLLGWVLVGPVGGLGGAPAGVVLSVWLGRLESPTAARAREEVDRDLPLAVDLLAACASVGQAPQDSLVVVSRAVGGALATRLDEIIARINLGADPVTEWGRLSSDPQLAQLGRTLQRSNESGAPLADGLARLAEDRRRERRTQTQLRARNVGVKAAGPLAACFLPAFMVVGVVPTVASSFQHLFA